jgi:L-histidine N-alpha-methyltransferase
MSTGTTNVEVHLDAADWSSHLAAETRRGLSSPQPWIPPVWFNDEVGSALFEEITRLPEYYPTRAERSILAARSAEIAVVSGADTLVELGSGTSEKTMLLLDALARGPAGLERFVPFDVSEAPLRRAAEVVAERWPGVRVDAVVGDFHRHLGEIPTAGRRMVAFLGGTIGNLDPEARRGFLAGIAGMLEGDESLLLGTDLVKDRRRLVAAYDDAAGVTAAFNRNALAVLDRELGADFDPDAFEHRAIFDEASSWIEMHLVARSPQVVTVAGLDDLVVRFAAGEHLRTELSAKFTPDGVAGELAAAGLAVRQQWSDDAGDFLLTLAVPAPTL